jgi:hypothetical protein
LTILQLYFINPGKTPDASRQAGGRFSIGRNSFEKFFHSAVGCGHTRSF